VSEAADAEYRYEIASFSGEFTSALNVVSRPQQQGRGVRGDGIQKPSGTEISPMPCGSSLRVATVS